MKSTIVVYAALLGLVTGCGQEIEPGRTPAEAPVVEGLGLQTAELASLSRGESYVGTVESRDRGILSARIGGRVAEMPVREGQDVQEGQLLLVLADNQAADRLAAARSGVDEAESALAAARADLQLAQQTHGRFAALRANEAVTPQEMDEVTARLEGARQQVARSTAALARARSDAAAARTAVSWTRVHAPYAARVVRQHVDTGSTVMPGAPLLTLDRQGAWQIRATVPESRIGRIAVGQELSVTLPSRDQTLTGTVAEILPTADSRSRSFEVKVALPDAPELTAGLFARVHAPAPRAQVLLVPAAAVVERGQLHGLYVVENGRLHFRLVRPGRRIDDRVEILSGLKPGEAVVVEGVARARDGARVEGG